MRPVGQLVDFIAERQSLEGILFGQFIGHNRDQLTFRFHSTRISEHIPFMPCDEPTGNEVKARQMPLEHIHIGIEPMLTGYMYHAAHVSHTLTINPCPVRLQVRPHRKDAHVIHT